jgi:stearoyl-CoA desaturase (delta-9 desaturase)
MAHKKNRKHINWTNTVFLLLVPIIGVVGTVLLTIFSIVTWQTWVLTGSLMVAGGLSITAGYHRLFAHQSYQAKWPLQLFLVLLGSMTFEGSVFEWSTDHRRHHRYTDTDRDPYNIKNGFWYAHIGWLFTLNENKRDFSNIKDLQKSRLLRFQHRYYTIICVTTGFIFPMAIASLWGAPFAGLIIAGALRVSLVHHATFCINSLCHILGKRNYSDKISARDNWFSALVTFGEGYHNYHHQFPLDYRNGVRFYHYDPTKWLVYVLSYLGLTSNLHRVPKYRIIQARIETHKNLMAAKPQHYMLNYLNDAILQLIPKIKEFEKAYAESKLKEYRVKLKSAKYELTNLFRAWKYLLQIKPVRDGR